MGLWTYIWIGVLVVSILIEAVTVQLTSIWISFGSFIAWIVAWAGGPVWLQWIVFVIFTTLMLMITRPLVLKYFKPQQVKTNADAIPGKIGTVLIEVSPMDGSGQVKIEGAIWSAKPEDGYSHFYPGDLIEVVRIEGVKAVIRKCPEH